MHACCGGPKVPNLQGARTKRPDKQLKNQPRIATKVEPGKYVPFQGTCRDAEQAVQQPAQVRTQIARRHEIAALIKIGLGQTRPVPQNPTAFQRAASQYHQPAGAVVGAIRPVAPRGAPELGHCNHGRAFPDRPAHTIAQRQDRLGEAPKRSGKPRILRAMSLPTIDDKLKRVMEPRVPSSASRLKTMEILARNGIPTSALLAPLIPAINDHEIEAILSAVVDAGAIQAHYIFLRLPHEVLDIFTDWLTAHFPDRRERVLSLVRQASGGRHYDARFGVRQTGRGAYADMLGTRFRTASRKLGLESSGYQQPLDCTLFRPPGQQQLGLEF